MPNIFKAIIGIAAFHNSQSPNLARIDTSVDKLHYRFTAGILFLSTTLLGLNDIFGKPIMCKSQVTIVDEMIGNEKYYELLITDGINIKPFLK